MCILPIIKFPSAAIARIHNVIFKNAKVDDPNFSQAWPPLSCRDGIKLPFYKILFPRACRVNRDDHENFNAVAFARGGPFGLKSTFSKVSAQTNSAGCGGKERGCVHCHKSAELLHLGRNPSHRSRSCVNSWHRNFFFLEPVHSAKTFAFVSLSCVWGKMTGRNASNRNCG